MSGSPQEDVSYDGLLRLAAAVVKGIQDPTEQRAWREWARERFDTWQLPREGSDHHDMVGRGAETAPDA